MTTPDPAWITEAARALAAEIEPGAEIDILTAGTVTPDGLYTMYALKPGDTSVRVSVYDPADTEAAGEFQRLMHRVVVDVTPGEEVPL